MSPHAAREIIVRSSVGGELCVRDAGDRSAIPIVFHHGTPGGRLGPPPVSLIEREGVRVISFDRPGYGRSTPHPGRSLADSAADVRAVIDALAIDRFATLGISGGGPYALVSTALLRGRVAACAIIASPTSFESDPESPYFAGMDPEEIEEYKSAIAGRAALEAVIARRRAERSPPPPIRVAIDDALRASNAGWVDDALALVAPWNIDFRDIVAPVRLWAGDADDAVPVSHARAVHALVPGSTLVIIPGADHIEASRFVEPPIAFLCEELARIAET